MKEISLPLFQRGVTAAIAAAVMFVFLALSLPGGWTAVVLFTLLYAFALVLLMKGEETERLADWAFAALAAAALIYARVCLLPYVSNDYNCFLVHWVATMRQSTFAEAMRNPIGDYNLPYLYFLWLIARFPSDDLVMIKFLSCLADVLAAWTVMKITALFTPSRRLRLAAFAAALALPTVLLNGAMWGQCDSIYGLFCLLTLYAALRKKGRWAVIFFALAFSFKLQTVFLAPALIACLFSGTVRPRHLLWFPAVNAALVLPALFSGRGLVSILAIYANQTASYSYLEMNAPTLFRLLPGADFSMFRGVGIMAGGTAALGILYLAFARRDRLNGRALVKLFYLSALVLPYLLPQMHERYFFLADLLALTVFLLDRRKWFYPVITVFASFNAYAYYLFGGVTLVDYAWVSLALLVLIILTVRDFLAETAPERRASDGTAE